MIHIAMDTKGFQAATDACYAIGGGTVRVPAGNYIIGTIKLMSDITLSLDYVASLLESQDMADL